jgi:DNA-binding cell septation regulator SpoVG
MTNITGVVIRKVTKEGSLKAIADFKLNDSEFFDWLIMVNKDGGLFVTSPSNSWLDKDGVKKYKQLIKFNKTLHSEIQVEILKKYSSDVVPGADDGDDVPY